MSRALVIKLQSAAALAVVVRDAPGAVPIEAAVRVPLPPGEDATAQGHRLRQALSALAPGRAPVVVVIPRADLYWQSIDLPPCPADDLPDLVHLQAQRDLPLADDGSGFDFVPLEGDETHPHRVIGVGVSSTQLDRIRTLCDAADVKLTRLAPEPLGWLEISARVTAADLSSDYGACVFAAMVDRQAAVWATEEGALRLLRTIWLPAEADDEADADVLAGELRRTLIALAQHRTESAALGCVYCGAEADAFVPRLTRALGREVRGAPLESLVDAQAVAAAASAAELAPLAGLGVAAAHRRPLLANLVHPRRRPAPPTRRRTYVLAGLTAALLASVVGWQAYRQTAAPLEAASADDAQRAAMAPLLEKLGADEQRTAAIDAWLAQSLNVLTELDDLGRQLRPQPLDSDDFKVDEDLVVTKLTFLNRTLTLDAAARTSQALQPAEQRLRSAAYRVNRNAVDANAKAVPGYSVSASALLEPGVGAAGAPAAADEGAPP